MVGIYKIQNKITNKIYIGQSNNLERRKVEHFNCSTPKQAIDKDIQKYGKDNFTYEVIEYCSEKDLNRLEQYWIAYYDSFYDGYNNTKGGEFAFCGNPILTRDDVIAIRKAYAAHQRRQEVYELYKDRISFGGFCHIWDGSRWGNIMPEVYNEENKYFHAITSRQGGNNPTAKLTDEQVIELRIRYQSETARKIWADYKDLYTYGSFQQILDGHKYSHLPIYRKSERKWINGEPKIKRDS